MALNPAAAYPGQINTTDPTGYPYGRARNVVAIGDGTGTPLEEKVLSDTWGFYQALLAAGSLVPSGTPDKVGASQYLDALMTVADARAKRSFLRAQAVNWPERAALTTGAALNSAVPLAWDPWPSSQGYSGNTGILMALTSNTLSLTSDEGSLWTISSSFGGILLGAAHDVAAGLSSGVRSFLASRSAATDIMRTIDGGVNWTLLVSTVPINSVLCNGPGSFWVAAGTTGAIKHSVDGITWTNAGQTVPGGWVFTAKRVVWNGSLYVVLPSGGGPNCLTSPDGLVWTLRSLGSAQTWNGLAYSATEGLWMAVALSGVVATSPDGLTWATAATAGAQGMTDLACIDSLWVATVSGGQYGGISYSVNRGTNWAQVSVGNHRVATAGWDRIIAADRRFVVAHATGTSVEFALSLRSF